MDSYTCWSLAIYGQPISDIIINFSYSAHAPSHASRASNSSAKGAQTCSSSSPLPKRGTSCTRRSSASQTEAVGPHGCGFHNRTQGEIETVPTCLDCVGEMFEQALILVLLQWHWKGCSVAGSLLEQRELHSLLTREATSDRAPLQEEPEYS